jgi:hypothetical protein
VQITVETEFDKRMLAEELQDEKYDKKETTHGKECLDVGRVPSLALSL